MHCVRVGLHDVVWRRYWDLKANILLSIMVIVLGMRSGKRKPITAHLVSVAIEITTVRTNNSERICAIQQATGKGVQISYNSALVEEVALAVNPER